MCSYSFNYFQKSSLNLYEQTLALQQYYRQLGLTCSVRLCSSCTALGKSLSIKSCQKVKLHVKTALQHLLNVGNVVGRLLKT